MKDENKIDQIDQWFQDEAKKVRIRPARSSWKRIDRRLESRRRSGLRPSAQNILFAAGFVLLLGMTFVLGFHSGQQKPPAIRHAVQEDFRVTDLVVDNYSLAYHDAMEEWIRFTQHNAWRDQGEESARHSLRIKSN